MKKKRIDTSWEKASKWYHETVGESGHYYHKNIILPSLLSLMDLKKNDSILDLGCGQGLLAGQIPEDVNYTGIDLSPSLISQAKKNHGRNGKEFIVGDVTKPLSIKKKSFTHAVFLLSLQNMEYPEKAIGHVFSHLASKGTLILILNHPCFRIPRQSFWGIDEEKKVQYRRIDRYMSPLKIPIQTHPGKGKEGGETWSFHFPLSFYMETLFSKGFYLCRLLEWCSEKTSTGKKAKMENRSREEIPLFLTFVAKKIEE